MPECTTQQVTMRGIYTSVLSAAHKTLTVISKKATFLGPKLEKPLKWNNVPPVVDQLQGYHHLDADFLGAALELGHSF